MCSLSSGFNINGKRVFMKVTSVICDAPARAFIKAIKMHTGYSGCGKCTQSGLFIKNQMTFPENNAPLRTDLSFRQMTDEDHHTGTSPLTDTSIDMVGAFPHDYMHLVCLGVTQRLLDLWLSTGALCVRISSQQIFDFARKARSLDERLRWKATELQQFLLYTDPAVLYNVLASLV